MLRGDVIHRTQDVMTERTALSIRCTNSNAPMNIDRMLAGCETKQHVIQSNPAMMNEIKQKFKLLNTNTTTPAHYFQKWIEQEMRE